MCISILIVNIDIHMEKRTNYWDDILVIAPNGKRTKEIVFRAHYSNNLENFVKIIWSKMAQEWLFN